MQNVCGDDREVAGLPCVPCVSIQSDWLILLNFSFSIYTCQIFFCFVIHGNKWCVVIVRIFLMYQDDVGSFPESTNECEDLRIIVYYPYGYFRRCNRVLMPVPVAARSKA